MIQITYNGVDITEDVSINRCYHDMYAGGQSDTMHLRVNDTKHLWDIWGPEDGDEIRVDYGTISTGVMFVSKAVPQNGIYDIMAQSAPKSGFDPQHKAWQKVRLLQLGEEIAKRNGLTFYSYGVTDRLYSYILQDGVGDFAFLHYRAMLEGCAFQVYDKRLVMYSEPYMESIEPKELLEITADGDYKYNGRKADLYGSCIVENGLYSGSFAVSNGSARLYRPKTSGGAGSVEEANRFAAGFLRSVNKGCYSGYVRSRILPGYAAASMLELVNARAPSWDGPVFLDHIRNDYGKGESKIFFRKPLEGY